MARGEKCGNVEENVEYFYLTVFKGTYRYRIDAKGRLPVPAPFRKVLEGAALVVTRLDECLAVYPGGEWGRLEGQLSALPSFQRNVKALTRVLASRAQDCVLDEQGRILLPGELRTAAGLGKQALVVGVLNRFEIWSPETWESFLRESETLIGDLTLDIQWPLSPISPAAPPPTPDPGGHPQRKPSR
jgi:MraZ protein